MREIRREKITFAGHQAWVITFDPKKQSDLEYRQVYWYIEGGGVKEDIVRRIRDIAWPFNELFPQTRERPVFVSPQETLTVRGEYDHGVFCVWVSYRFGTAYHEVLVVRDGELLVDFEAASVYQEFVNCCAAISKMEE